MDAELTDRERIAAAIGELVDRGYTTMPPWSVCCSNCGWAEIARRVDAPRDDLPQDLKTVWWHEQNDSYAFAEGAGVIPQTTAFMEILDHIEDDEADQWLQEHAHDIEADSVLARLTEYATLRAPLYLHWLGDKNEIAAALRAQGLRVTIPFDETKCLVVLPMQTAFRARPVNGEVVLEIDDEQIQLTAEDARKLVRRLNQAARQAEQQMPHL